MRSLLLAPTIALVFPALVTSCGMLANSAQTVSEKVKSMTDDEEQSTGGLQSLSEIKPQISSSSALLPKEEDILWASEDPDAEMQELGDLWENMPRQVDAWHASYSMAMQESRREGKPVLIWFTDSKSNSIDKALEAEVFSQQEFKSWAEGNVILLRVDRRIYEDDPHLKKRKVDYVNNLKKRYKVLGAPVVLVLSPRGASFGKYVGYKASAPEFYFGKLKSGYRNAVEDYGRWREEYERKGYRVWHDNRGRKVFAKPRALRDGTIYLITPGGKKSKTSLSNLSADDRAWVAEQKTKNSGR